MRLYAAVAFLVLVLVPFTGAEAQEVQVPMDEDGTVMVVDAALARRAGLWLEEYPGFVEARLFEAPSGSLSVEITERRGDRTVRHRLATTEPQVRDIRAAVSRAIATDRPRVDQEGRNLLIGQTVFTGLTFYGWAVPHAIGSDDGGTTGGLYLLTAAGSFFVPYLLTGDERVTLGMANLSRYGVTRGILHGLLLAELFEPEPVICIGLEGCNANRTNDRLRSGLAVVGSVSEGVAGYLVARSTDLSAGDAHTIALGGDVGLATGFLGHVALGQEDDPVRAAMALAGAGLGIAGGSALADRRDHSWGDAQVMYVATMAGAWALAAPAIAADSDEEVWAAAALIGGWGGLYLADRAVRRTEFSAGEAGLIGLATLAGGLAGAAPGVMMEDEGVAAVGSAIGSIGALALSYSRFARRPGGERTGLGRLDLSVNPLGLRALATGVTPDHPTGMITATLRF